MAGFFARYTKEGPGVDKNKPQKKAFFAFFEIYFRKFWKLCLANLLYVLVSLPILTKGLAEAGLTYITRSYVRERHAFVAADFFDTIRKNWKQALPAGIIEVVLSLMLMYGIYFYSQMESAAIAMIGLCGSLCVFVLVTFAYYYVYFLVVTFKLSMKNIFKNSVLLSSMSIARCFLVFFVLLAGYALLLLLLWSGSAYFWLLAATLYLFVFPAFRSLLIQYAVFGPIRKWMIDPYYQEHPDEDIELRLSLGLPVESEQAPKQEDVLFTDTGSTKTQEKEALPRQYSEREMRSFRSQVHRSDEQEDDQF